MKWFNILYSYYEWNLSYGYNWILFEWLFCLKHRPNIISMLLLLLCIRRTHIVLKYVTVSVSPLPNSRVVLIISYDSHFYVMLLMRDRTSRRREKKLLYIRTTVGSEWTIYIYILYIPTWLLRIYYY
jgi:hypothetical protein